jgi:AmmeMemoRadiSam system protein A
MAGGAFSKEKMSRTEGSQETRAKEGGMSEKDRLTEEEGRYLLSVARHTIKERLYGQEGGKASEDYESSKFSEQRGTFVTLTIDGCLRGCIGHIIPRETLLEGVRVNAINAAFRDPRFGPLSKKEFDKVEIEVSILTEPKALDYTDSDDLLNKIRPNIDGVIIIKGNHQATFLPQVWSQLRDKREFLSHLCMKSGLPGNAWEKGDLEVQTYQVQAFEEHD